MSVINGEPVAPSPDECVWYVCLTVQGRKKNRRGPMYYNDAMQTVRDWMVQPFTHGFVTATPPPEYPDPNARRSLRGLAPPFLNDDNEPILARWERTPASTPAAGAGGNINLTFTVTAANTTVEAVEVPPPAEAPPPFVEEMRRVRERWGAVLGAPVTEAPTFPAGTYGEAVGRASREMLERLQAYYAATIEPPPLYIADEIIHTTIDEDEHE